MVNNKPDILTIWFNYLEITMYVEVEVWIDEDEILNKLREKDRDSIWWDITYDFLEELKRIYDSQGKEAMLTKLEFLINEYKLGHVDLTS